MLVLRLFVAQVAIKKMKKKFSTWEECMQLREIKVRHRDLPHVHTESKVA